MTQFIVFQKNQAKVDEVVEHLMNCDADFVPKLSSRIDLRAYGIKLYERAERFEAWSGSELVGLVAAYCNDQEKRCGFITSVSVLGEWTGKGIASQLMRQCIEHAKVSGMRCLRLEVESGNSPAISLYEKIGFVAIATNSPFVTMNLYL